MSFLLFLTRLTGTQAKDEEKRNKRFAITLDECKLSLIKCPIKAYKDANAKF